MAPFTTIAQCLSIAGFAWFGIQCFVSQNMIREFERYRMARFRTLTGILQIAGSAGLLAGFVYRPLILLASAGLVTLMVLGIGVRINIRDPWYASFPALLFLGLNLFIFNTA
ncbi:MAG: DoxX family protein [Gemmatimonadaceae bacterium]